MRIHIFETKMCIRDRNDRNRGLSYSLNHCLKVAKGTYCARMDGDDLCDPSRFEKQVEFLDNNKEYGFVSTRMTRFDEHGTYQVPEPMESYSPTNKDFIKGSPFCHAPVMVRKSAYDAVQGYRDIPQTLGAVSYTHLDVYKRQGQRWCTMQLLINMCH